MKIKNEKELLGLFVEKDYRERFTRPFLNEYYDVPKVWATNRQVLIVVRKDCLTGEYPKENAQIRGLEERNYYSVVTKQALKDALGKCEQVEEVVTGKMIANPDNYVRIDAMAAKVSEVQIVIKAMELLGIDEIYHYVNAHIKPNLFVIDNDIKLIWMGRACEDDMELVKVGTKVDKYIRTI